MLISLLNLDMKKIAFLSSSGGTNFKSFLDAQVRGELQGVEICCLVTDKAMCGAAELAREHKIKVYFYDPKLLSKEAFQQSILDTLDFFEVDLVVLGGFGRILSPEIVEKYPDKILNIHPSLLPKHGGMFGNNIHQSVLDSGDVETGMTIHVVDEGVDTGKILLQKSVSVEPGDTVDSLKQKVQALEKEWYPKVVEEMLKD